MPLDPIVKMISTRDRGPKRRRIHTLPPAEARASYEAIRPYDAGGTRARGGHHSQGRRWHIAARLYAPRPTRPLPVVVYLHGGGWVIGDIDTHDALCRMIAKPPGAA